MMSSCEVFLSWSLLTSTVNWIISEDNLWMGMKPVKAMILLNQLMRNYTKISCFPFNNVLISFSP